MKWVVVLQPTLVFINFELILITGIYFDQGDLHIFTCIS